MEYPTSGVFLAAWCFLLAAVVCGGRMFASKGRHTSPGECERASSVSQGSPYKKPNRRLRRISHLQTRRTLANNMTILSHAKTLHNDRLFIVLEARIHQEKVTCFVDGGAERSLITCALHERLRLQENPYKTTIMGIGGAATTITKESGVPLCLVKIKKPVKALVCDQVPIGDVLLAADWLYEHYVTMTHRPPAIWFNGDRKTLINAITETPQLKASTTGTVERIYLERFAKLFSEPTSLPPKRDGVDYELRLSKRPEPSPEIAVKDPEAIALIQKQRDDL